MNQCVHTHGTWGQVFSGRFNVQQLEAGFRLQRIWQSHTRILVCSSRQAGTSTVFLAHCYTIAVLASLHRCFVTQRRLTVAILLHVTSGEVDNDISKLVLEQQMPNQIH
jgi:hypothetical protein